MERADVDALGRPDRGIGDALGSPQVIPPDHDGVVSAGDPLVLVQVRHAPIMDLAAVGGHMLLVLVQPPVR
jgi:hypothetical protein